jgi:hypothetical protein
LGRNQERGVKSVYNFSFSDCGGCFGNDDVSSKVVVVVFLGGREIV